MAITYDQVFGALNKRDKEIAQLIMPREGFSSTVYSDVDRQGTETGLAAGFGHRLTDEELKKYKVGDEIPHKQAVDWLRADIARTNEASWKQAYEVPNATEQLQDALLKVNFQLGPGWTQKFPTAWEHMKAGRWDQAIEEIKFTKAGSGQESKWMKQTPERAKDFITALQAQHEASFEKVPSMPEYTEQMGIWDEPPKAEPKDSSNMPNEISTNSQGFWEEEPSEQKQVRRNMTDNYNEKEDLSNFWTKATRTPQKVEEAIANTVKTAGKNNNNKTLFQSLPIPTHYKLFVHHAFWENLINRDRGSGTERPTITEKDFSRQDLKTLKEVLNRPHLISPKSDQVPVDNPETKQFKKEGYRYIKLQDQPKWGTSVDDKDRQLPSSLTKSLGGIWYKHNKDGTISIKDRYDFDPKDLSFPNILGVALGARETPGEISTGNLVDMTLK
jgi:GH24 family phage-related lysozyme (muramidase)